MQTPSTDRQRRGRPSSAQQLTPADRTDLWRRRLRGADGKEVRAYLGATAWGALQKLAAKGERGPYIEALILQAWRAQRRGAGGSG